MYLGKPSMKKKVSKFSNFSTVDPSQASSHWLRPDLDAPGSCLCLDNLIIIVLMDKSHIKKLMVKSFSNIFCISVVDHKRNNYDSCSSFIFFMFPTLCYNTTKTAYQTVPGPDTQRIIVAIKIIENKQGIMQVSNVLSMEIIIRKYYMQTVITLNGENQTGQQ